MALSPARPMYRGGLITRRQKFYSHASFCPSNNPNKHTYMHAYVYAAFTMPQKGSCPPTGCAVDQLTMLLKNNHGGWIPWMADDLVTATQVLQRLMPNQGLFALNISHV